MDDQIVTVGYCKIYSILISVNRMNQADVTFNDKKLIELLRENLATKNYGECIERMRQLGHVLRASAGKEVELINTYKELFKIVGSIFRDCGDKSPLSLRIVSLRVLTNAVLALAKQDMTNASTAYTIIVQEIEKEVAKKKPSVAFLISILDSIAICAKANSCPSDRKTVDCLLKLEGLLKDEGKLTRCSKNSLALALDLDLDAFYRSYSVGQRAKDLNLVLRRLGCSRLIDESQVTGIAANIPKQIPTPLEDRIRTHDMLTKLSPDQLADLVIQGFQKFPLVEGYVLPESAATLIERLAGGEEFEPVDTATNLIGTATFVIDQALEKMVQRSKFAPISVQSEFIAMLINTVDVTYDGFEEAKGPATMSAIHRAVDPEHAMIPFLRDWLSYEFARNSLNRYENLLAAVCWSIANQTVKEDDNPMRDFLIALPLMPDGIYGKLANLCSERPDQSTNILNAVNEFLIQAPAARESFLDPLMHLCIKEDDMVNAPAIHVLRESFYKYERFKEQINNFAKEQLAQTVEHEDDVHSAAILKLFFSIMELNTSLFLSIMEFYGRASANMKKHLRDGLEATVPKMSFDKGVVRKALEMASSEMKNVIVMHLYLSQLAKTLSVLPPEFVEMLKDQFLKQDDARYLIPIIPSLTSGEFIQFLPKILSMKGPAMRTAITSLLTAGQPLTPAVFLIELHKINENSPIFENAVSAMKFYFQHTDIITYESSIQAVEALVRKGNADMIVDTIEQVNDTFKDKIKYIVMHLLPVLINKKVYRMPRQWELMKKIMEKDKPHSFKAVVTLPLEYIEDFVNTYPDLRGMVINCAKQQKKNHVVERLSETASTEAPV